MWLNAVAHTAIAITEASQIEKENETSAANTHTHSQRLGTGNERDVERGNAATRHSHRHTRKNSIQKYFDLWSFRSSPAKDAEMRSNSV